MSFDNVYYLAIARAADKVVVASLNYSAKFSPPDVSDMLSKLSMQRGVTYNFSHQGQGWHVVQQDSGELFMIMCAKESYPSRIAAICLNELSTISAPSIGSKWQSAGTGSLSGTCKNIMNELCIKYDDLEQADKMTAMMAKVTSDV